MAVILLSGCPGRAQHPHEAKLEPSTLEIGRAGAQLRGVAGDDDRLYAAMSEGPRSTIEARRGQAVAWTTPLSGAAGPLARTPAVLIAALTGTGDAGGGPVRGEPGGALVGIDPATGAVRWRAALDSTQWVAIAALAPSDDSVIVGGSFAGTLRLGSRVVASAGGGDGFVARVRAGDGALEWLIRLGGADADAVQGVATSGARVVIAGTYTGAAELRGQPLPVADPPSIYADAFAAELDGDTGRGQTVGWTAAFGSHANDSVAGVALTDDGSIAVAATMRDLVHVGAAELTARGPADGLVAWLAKNGDFGATAQLGGADFDGLSAITAVDDRAIVGGFFAGSIRLGDRTLTAAGGDDAFLAAVDEHGVIAHAWQVGGEGREEVVAVAPLSGGFVAGIAHSARAAIDDVALPAPSDPTGGAALVVRALP
ncbi:MAG TPA: hypothetical protein VMJ10_15625 [Kofleriaceae bacterium]|nr:hypothetical protein [Kofleriaceae bacterium]